MEDKCKRCKRCDCQDEFVSYYQQKYEHEYLYGSDKLFLNQNGELLVKTEGGIIDPEPDWVVFED